METTEIKETLAEHKKWLDSNGEEGAHANLRQAALYYADLRRADLRRADLRYANLRYANLRHADLRHASLYGADLYGANLCRAGLYDAKLYGANLRYADLYDAKLCGADLRGANIDFSCWPLWCGSFDVIVDRRIAAQLAYHFCRLICDDPEVIQCQKALYKLANTFHRVGELPRLGDE